jgi:hypothetical protein
MKKLIALVLVIVLMASLAGCCCCVNLEECDRCGELTICSEQTLRSTGRRVSICFDCYERYEHLFK